MSKNMHQCLLTCCNFFNEYKNIVALYTIVNTSLLHLYKKPVLLTTNRTGLICLFCFTLYRVF